MDTKVLTAAKWSLVTEVLAKLITPITNIILAHILAPTAFGILATIMMVISFAEMLADAGFQKYLVQHEFIDSLNKEESVNVAFTSNLILAFLLWGLICCFRNELASLVGNPGLGFPLAIMGSLLPLSAFSSIQMAMYRREFDFKFLLQIRTITILAPLLISIPLAYLHFDYWSLIAGLIGAQFFTALALFIRGTSNVRLLFNISIFKSMFSYSAWSLAEAFSIWLTAWVDTFIISHFMDAYYLGIYKMPMAIVTTMMSVATASMAPVLFSALSRVQHDIESFSSTFFTFQRYMALFLVPLGVGLFVYQDFIVHILLGPQWQLASIVLGSWALSSAFMTVTANLVSEIFRAKGIPNISFATQVVHLVVLIPVIYISVQYDFSTFVYTRSLVRIQMLITALLFVSYYVQISGWRILFNISSYVIGAALVGFISYGLVSMYESYVWTLTCMLLSCILYIFVLWMIPRERVLIQNCKHTVLHRLASKS